MTVVAKVWIDEDCITCDACQDICPEVFEVNDETSQILAAVRLDGGFDRNE
jgi:ferredoxin